MRVLTIEEIPFAAGGMVPPEISIPDPAYDALADAGAAAAVGTAVGGAYGVSRAASAGASGSAALGFAGLTAAAAAGLAVAAVAGWHFGGFLNRTFGISDYIVDYLMYRSGR